MTIDALTASPTATRADNAAASLASDFDQFLSLLTTQLQQQDPLEPLDSNQFTEQLVQFTSVEQQIQTNQNLEALLATIGAQNQGSAVDYLGKVVTVDTDQSALGDTPANWSYELSARSPSTALNILDANNQIVFTAPGQTEPGIHAFEWDGTDGNGNRLPDGLYRLSVGSETASGTRLAQRVFVEGEVSDITLENGESLLTVGSIQAPLSLIRSVSQPSRQTEG
ncbi:MAG: flagellar hook capping FlgD N-terminal domain-containing protein [Pseudomonadota bacterium]